MTRMGGAIQLGRLTSADAGLGLETGIINSMNASPSSLLQLYAGAPDLAGPMPIKKCSMLG